MKIIYEDGVYHINTEYPETEFHVCTSNIAKAKENYSVSLAQKST